MSRRVGSKSCRYGIWSSLCALALVWAGARFATLNAQGQTCYQVSPTSSSSASVYASGTSYPLSFFFAVGPSSYGCTWYASSNYSWLSVSPGNGFGYSGQVSIQVASNPSTFGRTGAVTIAGANGGNAFFIVDQAARVSISSPTSLPAGTEGAFYSPITFTATGMGGFTWSATGLPNGVTFVGGVLSGTPATGTHGIYNPTFQVTDASQATASVTLSLTIIGPLSITGPSSLPSGTVGVGYGPVTFSATGGIGGYTWSASSLPNGLSLSPAGVLSGNPAAGTQGNYSIQFAVRDSSNATAATTLPLLISTPLTVVSPTSLPPGSVGVSYLPLAFTATGGAGGYTWSATGLPNGLTLSTVGVLSGVPSTGSQGVYNPRFTVRDSNGASASLTLIFTINSNVLSILTPTTLPPATVGQVYPPLTFTASGGTGPYTWSSTALPNGLTFSTSGVLSGTPANGTDGSYTVQFSVQDSTQAVASTTLALTITASGPFYFVSMAPCHLVDTRAGNGFSGSFGPPAVSAGQIRTFNPTLGSCPGIPNTAKAYSLNVTAAPTNPVGVLGFLTIWPAGQPQPFVSTLNGPKGRSTSNSAIVPAGAAGGVSVYVTDDSDVMVDIDGYFDSVPSSNASAFYALAPCRVADTRRPIGTLGGPAMDPNSSRDFPLPSSNCFPPNALATSYSLNITAVPGEPLGTIEVWPAGSPQPLLTSDLTAPFGDVTANATFAEAGLNGGAISLFSSNRTDVIIDTNGYFGPMGGAGALLFTPLPPCRVVDTRRPADPFGGPILSAGTSRRFAVPSGPCNLPANVAAYSFNVTVVPSGPLGYLTIWPADQPQPFVSTLNSWDGRIVANAAIVPAAKDDSISVYVTNDCHLVLDINGYFTLQSATAPSPH